MFMVTKCMEWKSAKQFVVIKMCCRSNCVQVSWTLYVSWNKNSRKSLLLDLFVIIAQCKQIISLL